MQTSLESPGRAADPSVFRPLQHYMLCRDAKRVAEWERRRPALPGVDLRLRSGFPSMYAFIANAIAESDADVVVVSHDDVIMGSNFASRVRDLATELDARFVNWGIAGNAGVGIDGKSYAIHVKDPWCEPTRSAGPQPVLTLDGNLLLVNRRKFLEAGCEYPDLGGFHGYDLVLALECLRKGLLVIADRRLTAIHLSGGNKGAYAIFNKSDTFTGYLRARFSNTFFPTMLGPVTLPPSTGASVPGVDDLHDLYDRALSRDGMNRKPSLTMIRLGGDPTTGAVDRGVEPLLRLVDVEHAHVRLDASNTLGEAVLAGATSATSDYVWLVPADARIEPGALRAVARALAVGTDRVVALGHELVEREGDVPATRPATDIVRAAFGRGPFPYWAAVYPTAILRARIDEAGLPADQLPALLSVLALTAAGVDLVIVHDVVLRGRSLAPRVLPEDGYGSAADWEHVTRLGSLLSSRAFGSPTLWNVAEVGAPFMWNAAARAALEAPSPIVKAATSAGQVVDAGIRVLREPGKYLRRGLGLLAHYLVRGDVKGLLREVSLFRGR